MSTNGNGNGKVKKKAPGRPWPKGVSGNPKGRPKVARITDLIRVRLTQMAKDVPYARVLAEKLGRDASDTTVAEVMVDALLIAAIKGKAPVLLELINRIDGKVPDRVEGTFSMGFDVVIPNVRRTTKN